MTDQPRKAGRPHGSLETPQTLLTRELKATVKAVGTIREVVESQVERIAKILAQDHDIPVIQQLDYITKLGELSQTLTKNAEMLAKYLMDKRVRQTTEDSDAPESKPVSSSAIKNLLK